MALEKANIAQLKQAGDLINARDREKQLVMAIAAAQVEAVGGTAAQQIEAAKLAEEILKIKHAMEDAALAAKAFEEAVKNASGSGRGVDPRKFMEVSPIGWLTPEVLKKYKEFMAEQNKGKGKEPTTMEGPIKALERQIELSKALFGLEGEERRRKEVFMQLEFQNRDLLKQYQEDPERLQAIADEVAAQEKLTKVFEEQRQAQKDLADSIANSMGDALTSIVDGTKSVSDAFKDMARAIIAELYQIYVVKQITGMISGGIDSFMGFNASASANGNVFSNGNLVPYADGGVVGGPTYFPMNDGRTGLMGEAGPEAIMPLKRGKDGKLGVQAEGGAGDVIIHQNFNFQANGDESVKKIIAQQAPAIANMTKKQILDDRRRGGQMKQAFG